ncbi:hypothetical protein C922_02618 [Plasmodium inui San Antonio 1]|uniref:Uncharacterized protein n=1 Tax=Plasmodium inui San Antonio 1 TaxID=1237626 RepID=W7ADC3_9APIC|nr:hypothetical protein C922_02618 [Plasmodium inui San Antonio 1]EUD67034.1 hypothetical protein C922_02618 [Plasmodium inui San Antonio 1]
MMKTNHSNVRTSFVYNEKVNELVEKVIFLARSLSHYRKKYVTFLKMRKCEVGGETGSYPTRGEIQKSSLNRSGNSETGGGLKGRRGKKNYAVKQAKYNEKSPEGCSFFHVFTSYEQLVHNLLHLCCHETDIYIEFLYTLIINSELFNHFLYICTFTSGDKDDRFLLLIYKHFLTLVEYYFYFNNFHYFNELYRSLKGIYDNKDVNEAGLRENDKNCLTSQAKYEHNDSTTRTEGENNFLFTYPSESSDFVNYEHNDGRKKKREIQNRNRKTNCSIFEVNESGNTFKDTEKHLISQHNLSTSTKGVKHGAANDTRGESKCVGNTIKTEKISHSGETFSKFLSHASGDAEGDNQGDFHCNYNCDFDYGEKKKKHSCHGEVAHASNANFNINNFYKLKNMFLMFNKLNYEHLYILLYFSLSILPTLFHVYLTRVLITRREDSIISPYLMYVAKRIKERSNRFFKIDCNGKAGERGYREVSARGEDHIGVNITGSINNRDLFKGDVQKGVHAGGRLHQKGDRSDGERGEKRNGYHTVWDEPNDKLWEHINRLNMQAKLDTLTSGGDASRDYSAVFSRNISLLHAFQIRGDFESLNYEVVDEQMERGGNRNERSGNGKKQSGNGKKQSGNGKKRSSEDKPGGNTQRHGRRRANQENRPSGEAISEGRPKEGPDSTTNTGTPHQADHVDEAASIQSVPLMSRQRTPLYDAEKELQDVLKKNLQWNRIYSFYQSELKTAGGLQNARGLQDFIKSISIICSEQFFSFYMNRIDMKKSTEGDYHLLQVDQCSSASMKQKTEQETHWGERHTIHPGNHLHMASLHKDTTLIHNDYIKKKIKRNRLYTYKIFNNQIETLLNSKELAEYIKKKKKKKSQQEKKKENFIYMQSPSGCPLLNRKNKKKISDVPFTFAQNKNDNFIESDCNSYENSDSSDNLSMYNYTKEFYADNGFNINEFVLFVLNSFYLFMHIHNVYFSCTYLNVLLSYSIKLLFKYSNRCVGSRVSRLLRGHLPGEHTGKGRLFQRYFATYGQGYEDTPHLRVDMNIPLLLTLYYLSDMEANLGNTSEAAIAPFAAHNGMKIVRKRSSVRVMRSHTQEGDLSTTVNPQEGSEFERIKQLTEMILRKKKFFNKKKRKEKNLNCSLSPMSSKCGNKTTLLMNTFDIILNSFLDLCISMCSVDFNFVSDKRKQLNRRYFCNCICKYNHMLNREYKESALRRFNEANYNDSVEAYLFYFDELKGHALFSKRIGQAGKGEEQEKQKQQGGHSRTRHNRSDSTHLSNHSDGSSHSLYFSKEKRRRASPRLGVKKKERAPNGREHKNATPAEGVKNDGEKRLLKKKKKKKMDDSIFSYMMMARESANVRSDTSSSMTETEEDHNGDDAAIYSINTSSDGSFLFLKKMKRKIKKRIYLDENNIIKMLTSVGCIFMNNIKYTVGVTISNLKRVHQNGASHGASHGASYAASNGASNKKEHFFNHLNGVFYCEKKNSHLANIYNQYFVSFLFFFKMHYLFFLIKYKCENEIFPKAYWFLYAVYSITQG